MKPLILLAGLLLSACAHVSREEGPYAGLSRAELEQRIAKYEAERCPNGTNDWVDGEGPSCD